MILCEDLQSACYLARVPREIDLLDFGMFQHGKDDRSLSEALKRCQHY